MALNTPWLLILLYLLPYLPLGIMVWQHTKRNAIYTSRLAWLIFAGILLGAGLALLGAAYLHDVWYC